VKERLIRFGYPSRKTTDELFSDTFTLCKSTLASLLKRPSLKPEIEKHYDDVIREWLKQ